MDDLEKLKVFEKGYRAGILDALKATSKRVYDKKLEYGHPPLGGVGPEWFVEWTRRQIQSEIQEEIQKVSDEPAISIPDGTFD